MTVDNYIEQLPDDRKNAMQELRKVFVENLSDGFHECISYGMIGYVVPLSIYPSGYHCDSKLPLPFINLASQKSHIALLCVPRKYSRGRNFHPKSIPPPLPAFPLFLRPWRPTPHRAPPHAPRPGCRWRAPSSTRRGCPTWASTVRSGRTRGRAPQGPEAGGGAAWGGGRDG
jgi:hypothetical protein